jgi:hypothetical protein
MADEEESSLSPKGEDHGRHRGTLERVSRNLPAQGARNGQKVVPGTGEIRLDAGKHKAIGRQPAVPDSHDVDNQWPWETAKCVERKSEEAVVVTTPGQQNPVRAKGL